MFRRRSVTITAGEPDLNCWCPVCLLPIRLRVPLHAGDLAAPPVAVLEICPGCGTGHDRPNVAVTPPPRGARRRLSRTAVLRAVHAWWCHRKGLPALPCAFADCERPGLWRHEYEMTTDEGTWRIVFCSRHHRKAWAEANGFRLEVTA